MSAIPTGCASNDQIYLKSEEEMRRIFGYSEAVDNTYKIAQRYNGI